MGYEHELRKEALRLARERGFPIQRALWAAYNDSQHSLKNFLNFLKLDTADQSESDNLIQQLQVANKKLEQKVAELERAVRSRFPRGKVDNRSSQGQLALPALATGKGNKGKGKNSKGRDSIRQHDQFFSGPDEDPQATGQPGVYFLYQSGTCAETACPKAHIWLGCGKQAGYDQCKCLHARTPVLTSDCPSQEAITVSPHPSSTVFVKPEENVCRILVLSYSTLHTADAVGAWKEAHTEGTSFSHVVFFPYHFDEGDADFWYCWTYLILFATSFFFF